MDNAMRRSLLSRLAEIALNGISPGDGKFDHRFLS
jgi:hypothetical protein